SRRAIRRRMLTSPSPTRDIGSTSTKPTRIRSLRFLYSSSSRVWSSSEKLGPARCSHFLSAANDEAIMTETMWASIGDHGVLSTRLSSVVAPVWIDRDLSWLDFNHRVLTEALDDRTPLLERVKFLAIFTSNLDEFFMKRIALLREEQTGPAHQLRAQVR